MRKAVLYHPKRAVKKVCGVGMIQSLLMPPFFLFFLVLIHTQSPASSRVFVALELMQSLYATIFFFSLSRPPSLYTQSSTCYHVQRRALWSVNKGNLCSDLPCQSFTNIPPSRYLFSFKCYMLLRNIDQQQ